MKMLLKVLLIFLLRGLNDVQASDDSHAINDSRHIKTRQKRYYKGYNPENNEIKGSSAMRSCKICGENYVSPSGMVVKGNDVNPPYKYPASVVLQTQGETFCGGSLLSADYILTAAHCLIKQEKEQQQQAVKGKMKELKYMKPNELTIAFVTTTTRVKRGPSVAALIPHPGFAKSRLKHDIALLKLSRKITCDKFKIPICLPSVDVNVNVGQIFTIVGWGTAGNHSKDASKTLKEAKIRKVNYDKCKNSFPRYMEPIAYCLMGIKGQSPCMGDSGGPMFNKHNGRFFLYGVTSIHSSEVCDANTPFLYTSVPKHIQWIKTIMGPSFPKQEKQKPRYKLGVGKGLKGGDGGVHEEDDKDLPETPYRVEPTDKPGSKLHSQGSNGGDVGDRLPRTKGGSPGLPDRGRPIGVPGYQGSNRGRDGGDIRDRLPQTKEGFSGLPYPGRSIGDPDFNPDRGSRGWWSRNNQGISGPVRPKVDPDLNPDSGSRGWGSRNNQGISGPVKPKVDPDFNPDRGSRGCGSRNDQSIFATVEPKNFNPNRGSRGCGSRNNQGISGPGRRKVDPDFNPDRGSRRFGSRNNQGISGPVRPKVDPDFIPDRGSRGCGSRNNQGAIGIHGDRGYNVDYEDRDNYNNRLDRGIKGGCGGGGSGQRNVQGFP